MTDQDINNTYEDETQSASNPIQDQSDEVDTDDITFEQDADTRENTAPDAVAKVAKLKAEIEKLKTEKQQYLDNWQRDKAEFVNARRRDEESKAEFLKFAVIGFAEELLPIIDSFEAALKHEGSKEGVELIYTQFKSVLKKQGIEEFGQVGDAFDPSLHQAIGNVDTADKNQDHTVAEVLQKGYQIHGKVIRPAFVKVFQCI